MNENIQVPTGEFRKYIEVDGTWRHVYIVSTHWQVGLFGEETKMVQFTLTKKSKTIHTAERSKFKDQKPRKVVDKAQ